MPKLRTFVIAFMAVTLLFVAGPRFAQAQTGRYSLDITNESGVNIERIYVSSSNHSNWGSDQLGYSRLSRGTSLTIRNLSPGEYDIKIVTDEGESCVIPRVQVFDSMRWSLTAEYLLNECGEYAIGGGGGGGSGPSEGTLPQFPWPPPTASASEVVPSPLLQQHRQFKQLKDLDALLLSALEKNGYVEKSYYAVPKGFALVTRLEQIGADGVSKPPPARWSPELPKLEQFTVGEYIRALFTAKAGYYRIIVFVVTAVPFAQRDAKLSEDEVQKWLSGGLNVLPEAIGSQQYTSSTVCTALIYEFERQQDKAAELRLPSRLDSRTHLVKSGIWKALQEGQ